jgi:hypothetical protein
MIVRSPRTGKGRSDVHLMFLQSASIHSPSYVLARLLFGEKGQGWPCLFYSFYLLLAQLLHRSAAAQQTACNVLLA